MREKVRVALVLDGGGAKGAYQVGCWKAIREARNFEIKGVAGSSVGALNAVLMAANQFDTCHAIWTGLRPWHVVGVKPRNLLYFPIWFVALLLRVGSKPTVRTLGVDPGFFTSLYLGFVGFVYLTTTHSPSTSRILVAVLVALFLAGDFAWLLRRIILSRGLTTNGPLTKTIRTIVEDPDFNPSIASYATISRWEPYASHEYWFGWAPEYVRFDRMDRTSIAEVLLASASLPGVFASSSALGHLAIDGGWCDNSPLAPLLYELETELDLILVLHLSPDALEVRPPGLYLFNGLGGRNPFDFREPSGAPDAVAIARAMWESHQRVLHYRDRSQLFRSSPGNLPGSQTSFSCGSPRIVRLTPSKDLGGFLDGTLAFSAKKARSLIALGEHDMVQLLRSLDPPQSL
jgi:predicted acylesterase/phospholipase RssA